MNIGDRITFTFRGRSVDAVIVEQDKGVIWAKLNSNYFGKNMDWEAGEHKAFGTNLMKNVKVVTPNNPTAQ